MQIVLFFGDFLKFSPPHKTIEFTKNAPWGINKKVAFEAACSNVIFSRIHCL